MIIYSLTNSFKYMKIKTYEHQNSSLFTNYIKLYNVLLQNKNSPKLTQERSDFDARLSQKRDKISAQPASAYQNKTWHLPTICKLQSYKLTCLTGGGSCHLSNFFSISSLNASPRDESCLVSALSILAASVICAICFESYCLNRTRDLCNNFSLNYLKFRLNFFWNLPKI